MLCTKALYSTPELSYVLGYHIVPCSNTYSPLLLVVFRLWATSVHEIIATTAWFIWWRRRDIKFEGKSPTASRLALSVRAMVANSLKTKKNKSGVPKEGWQKPPEIEYGCRGRLGS
jgi:hypothetical protein